MRQSNWHRLDEPSLGTILAGAELELQCRVARLERDFLLAGPVKINIDFLQVDKPAARVSPRPATVADIEVVKSIDTDPERRKIVPGKTAEASQLDRFELVSAIPGLSLDAPAIFKAVTRRAPPAKERP